MKKTLALLFIFISFQSFSQKGNWIKLFDGKNLDHWYAWKINDGASTTGWEIEKGVLTTDGKEGDLVTKQYFKDFEFVFSFKISPEGNSGIIYKVQEKDGHRDQPYRYGPEFQIIDDVNYPETPKDVHKTGGNYDVYPPSDFSAVKPAGQWNKAKIIIKNNHVQHWLNGKLVNEYEYGGEQWKTDVAASKFRRWSYATPKEEGKISLQGHNDRVWFKKMKIREL